MTELEAALVQREKANRALLICVIATMLISAAVAAHTYANFDVLYAQQRSVYPATSAIATLPNVFGALCLILINVAAVARVRRASQTVSLKAYSLMMTPTFARRQADDGPLKHSFLHAAGLPEDYSMDRLAKVKTFHFASLARPIARAIARHRAGWIALSRSIEKAGH